MKLPTAAIGLAVSIAAAAHAQCFPSGWHTGFSSEHLGSISAVVTFDDGTGPTLYAYATATGDWLDGRLQRWNGSHWTVLETPVLAPPLPSTSNITALDPDGPGPAEPGIFLIGTRMPGETGARYIHAGDGRTWSVFGRPFDLDPNGSLPRAVAVFDDDGAGPGPPALFATGSFRSADGVTLNGVAKWDGSRWGPLGDGLSTSTISSVGGYALAVFDPDGPGPERALLVVGGEFTIAGGLPARYIAAWNGTAWSSLGDGLTGRVHALTVFDFDGDGPAEPELVAGGFITVDSTNGVARWNGSRWAGIGAGTGAGVSRLDVADLDDAGPAPARLVAGGNFILDHGFGAKNLAQWTGASWEAVTDAPVTPIGGLGVFDPDGDGPTPPRIGVGDLMFSTSPHRSDGLRYVSLWDGHEYVALTHGVGQDNVTALTLFDPDGPGPVRPQTIVAGSFWSAGMTAARGIAAWDGARWTPLGSGLDGDASFKINAMAVFDDDGTGPRPPALFVAGRFNTAGGIAVSNIARWDGHAWSALAEGLSLAPDAEVRCLEVFDDDGSGPSPPYLYAGGSFQTPGSSALKQSLARWDGTSWSIPSSIVLGRPWLSASISSLTSMVIDGEPRLVVGGGVTTFGDGVFTTYSALSWNGTSWFRVGLNEPRPIGAMTVYDADGPGPRPPMLIAAGDFTSVASRAARYLARWDGSEWLPLGPPSDLGPFTASPTALAVHDPDGPGPARPILYAVGPISSTSEGLAAWNGDAWDTNPLSAGNTPGLITAASLADAGPGRPPALYLGGEMLSVAAISSGRIARYGCPIAEPCRVDLDADGTVNFGDHLFFLNLYDSADPGADFTADGSVDFADYLEFLNLFEAGC